MLIVYLALPFLKLLARFTLNLKKHTQRKQQTSKYTSTKSIEFCAGTIRFRYINL
ncbi:hypothetical protein AAHE18_02G098000 [Arachis hypogaea]